MEVLERWFQKKYRLPSNHELFLSRTYFDLLVEFYEDYYERNPLEVHRQEDGEIQLKDTGDSLIDKWEEQLAEGKEPDLWESFSEESKAKLQKLRSKKKKSGIMSIGDTQEQYSTQQEQLKSRSGWDNKALFGDESDIYE